MGCFMLSSQLSHHGQSEKSIISTDNMSDFSYHLMLSSFIGSLISSWIDSYYSNWIGLKSKWDIKG